MSAPTKTDPAFIEPMQCLAVPALPEGDSWTWEVKYDGYRALALKSRGKVTLLSRNANSLSARFPEVVAAVGDLAGDFVLDAELVALDSAGRPSFQALQSRADAPICLYCFDVLHASGRSLVALPIEERRQRLAKILAGATRPVLPSPQLTASPAEIVAAVRKLRLEGVVGKRRGSIYEPGRRSGAWVKFRTNRAQEFVIGGYVPGSRGFDSLLVGYYHERRLLYAGKVRAGFTPRIRDQVFPHLAAVRATRCPFVNLPETGRQRWGEALTKEKMEACRWLRPQLVCNVEFVEWTSGGKLRHPSFQGLRDDKPASAVVREPD